MAEEVKQSIGLPELKVQEIALGDDLFLKEDHIQGTLNIFVENWETIIDKVTRNCIAASAITKVTNDEEDAKAEAMIKATRKTFEVVEKLTKEITDPLDDFRSKLIAPKKKISSIQSDSASEYWRLKNLRDRYASAKHAKNKTMQVDIEKKRQEQEECIRLQMLLSELVSNFVSNKIKLLDDTIQSVFDAVTLETLPALEQRITGFKPTLKVEQVNAIFVDLIPNTERMADAVFQDVYLPQFKSVYTYDAVLKLYSDRAVPLIEDWKVKISALRVEMEQLIAALDADDKEKADEVMKASQERIEREQKEKEEKFAEVQRLAKIAAEQKATAASLNNSFSAVAEIQQKTEQVNGQVIREANIDCPPEKIVEVFAKVLYACFQSPKFEGWCKIDLEGKPIRDEDGIPLYTPWAERLMSFWAKNCPPAIQYIEIKERISTRAKN